MPKKYIPHRKLELDWFKKNKSLIWDNNTKDYRWVENNDIRVSEPRVLKLNEKIGFTNSCYDKKEKKWSKNREEVDPNMLISGDNLLALKSIEDKFTDRIKLVYIDPPFNTGKAFEHYDDGLEHSIWLSMMRSRLEMLYKLLKNEGVIFIHIDYNELAHLKLLMDEIFGRGNFITIITCKVKGPSGVATGNFVFDIAEYILCYRKTNEFKGGYINKFPVEIINEKSKTSKQYNFVFLDEGKEEKKIAEFKKSNGEIIEIIKHKNYNIKTVPRNKRTEEFYLKNFDRIFRVETMSGGVEKQLVKSIPNEDLYSYVHTPSKGRHKGKAVKAYVFKKGAIHFLRNGAELIEEYSEEAGKLIKRPAKVHTITNIFYENWWLGIAKEGNVEFKAGKKPEKLLKRIIEMVTKPNDWVLDSFVGSGTTGAVAHKLGRKWVAIEKEDKTFKEKTLPRLKDVVSGKDNTGISKEIKWGGGGGFCYYELAPSLFKKDEYGIVELAFSSADLIEAICKIEGFKFVGRDFLNKTKLHGVVNQTRYCHVTEEMVTQDHIDELDKEISNKESLVIYCKKHMSNLTLPENMQIKKIPRDLMKRFTV